MPKRLQSFAEDSKSEDVMKRNDVHGLTATAPLASGGDSSSHATSLEEKFEVRTREAAPSLN